MECKVDGCGKKLRSDNSTGFCVAHRDRHPDRFKNRRTPEQMAKFRTYALAQYWADPDPHRKRAREYNAQNREKCRASRSAWARDNPHKEVARVHRRRTAKADAHGYWTEADWLRILDTYGHRCPKCGARDNITVDHVIPLTVEGTSNWPSNLQPLCHSCNSSKRNRDVVRLPPWQD